MAFDRRQRVQLGSAEGYVVRKEDLIISKIAWAEDSQSDVQKRDVQNLMATDYDEEYLEHGLKELGRRQAPSPRRTSQRRRWSSPNESAAYSSPVSTSSGSAYS